MASRSVNKVLLIGNLGRDAETKFTQSGISYTRFSIATTRSWKDQQSDEWREETNWTNVTAWRKENHANYLSKGQRVYVEGRLQTRSYDDREGRRVYITEVIADDILLLGGANREEQPSSARSQNSGASNKGTRRTANGSAQSPATALEDDQFEGMGITDDDVPFDVVSPGA